MDNENVENENSNVESKEDKFKRLAGARVNNAISKISLIGNLANPSYSYTPEQADKIISALKSSVTEVEEKLQKTLDRKKKQFEL